MAEPHPPAPIYLLTPELEHKKVNLKKDRKIASAVSHLQYRA